MADYAQVNGAHMWYDERGDGEPVVLLHGGLTDSRSFFGNLDKLGDRFRLYLPDRRGHGRTADVEGPITMEVMAQDIIAFLDDVVGGPARLVGYSAGAGVALWVAARRPDLVTRLVLISGTFDPEGLIVRPVAGLEPPAELLAHYAEVSPDGADHFSVVINKIVESTDSEPGLTTGELNTVTCPALVMAGDDDIVTLEHTISLYRGLPNSQLAIIPNASHLLLFERGDLCVKLVTDFLTQDPTPTFMPMRRSPRPVEVA
ncbi:alpha/beta fold hydrolase [Rhizohabitans arisaemae]|uniref:alpha/beta fold hydrolase n=1 Tax=Rhizohabitans arisaemae TaxID=2720610 RepID=UPI0024B27E04|nr:alpha/beta hydrolase [Rhizohabitans arisaemae]